MRAAHNLPDDYNNTVHGLSIGLEVGSWGTIVFKNELTIVKDIVNDPLWENYRELALSHNLKACLSMAISGSRRNVLGAFAIYYKEVGMPSSEDLEILKFSGVSIVLN